MKAFILLLFLPLVLSSFDQDCRYFLSSILNFDKFTNNYDDVAPSHSDAFLFSGKYENDMGLYSECVNLKTASYVMITVHVNNSKFKLGLCYPNECDAALLEADFLKKIGKNERKITSYDVKEEMSKLDSMNLTLVMLLVSLCGFFLIAYFSNFLCKKEQKEISTLEEIPNLIGVSFSAKRRNEKWRKKTVVSDHADPQETCFSTFIAQFDLIRNCSKIFKTEIKEFRIIYSIRVVSLLTIFFAMAFYTYHDLCMQNTVNLPEIIESTGFLIYSQLPIAINLFLFTNGFITYFKLHVFLLEDNPRLRIFTTFVAFKVINQLPILVIMTVTIICLPYAGSGPMFFIFNLYSEKFKQTALFNFIYIQNFFQTSFFDHFWIYAVEMQTHVLYIITSCILMERPRLKWFVVCFTVVASLICLFCLNVIRNSRFFYYYDSEKNKFQFQDSDFVFTNYLLTFTRCWPYLLGVMVAKTYSFNSKIIRNLFVKTKSSMATESDLESMDSDSDEWTLHELIGESKILGVFFLLLSFLLMTYPLVNQMFLKNTEITAINAFSLTFDSFIFLVGLSFSLLVLSVDYFSSLRSIFDNKIFYILGNSHYAIYLMTPALFVFYFCSQQNTIFFTHGDFFLRTFGVILVSVMLSIALTIVVHLPFKLFLNKVLFRGMKRIA